MAALLHLPPEVGSTDDICRGGASTSIPARAFAAKNNKSNHVDFAVLRTTSMLCSVDAATADATVCLSTATATAHLSAAGQC
jgi:hypothetical protein